MDYNRVIMDFTKRQLFEALAEIAPDPYVQGIMLIILFGLLAKIMDLVITRILKKWAEKTNFSLDDQIIDIFHRPVFFTIIFFGLALAAEKFGFSQGADFIITSLLKTMAIFLWSLGLAKFLKILCNLASQDENRMKIIQVRTLPLFNNLLVLMVSGFAVYSIFLVWNIDLTAWVASAGILGLAISFAAKDTLANLFSGVFIMADAPYKLGDFIVLDSGERGQVTNIGIRSTRILTRDDVEITIPNSIMGNTKIINEAGGRHEKFRIRIKVGVAYGSDLDRVHKVLLEEASELADVCKTPGPRVRFRGFGDSSLDHELLCWVKKPVLRGRVSHRLNTNIYKRFQQEKINIPFPQREVYLRSEPENTSNKKTA